MASKADEIPLREAPAQWLTQRERGSPALLRLMTIICLRLGRRVGRVLLVPVAVYFVCFAPRARRASVEYLARALGRRPSLRDRFLHVWAFASTILDRLYLTHQRFDLFDVSIEGEQCVREGLLAGHGAFLLGAHVGSFEIVRSVGLRQPGMRVAMAMYEANARKVNGALSAVSPALRPEIISLGRMDAMLRISECLDRGVFVGVLGDRTLGAEASLPLPFLGATARLPIGALRVAAVLRRPVIFMVGLYLGGNRYRVRFAPLADFSSVAAGERDRAVAAAAARYVAMLEQACREAPYNWFNFYDFWR